MLERRTGTRREGCPEDRNLSWWLWHCQGCSSICNVGMWWPHGCTLLWPSSPTWWLPDGTSPSHYPPCAQKRATLPFPWYGNWVQLSYVRGPAPRFLIAPGFAEWATSQDHAAGVRQLKTCGGEGSCLPREGHLFLASGLGPYGPLFFAFHFWFP